MYYIFYGCSVRASSVCRVVTQTRSSSSTPLYFVSFSFSSEYYLLSNRVPIHYFLKKKYPIHPAGERFSRRYRRTLEKSEIPFPVHYNNSVVVFRTVEYLNLKRFSIPMFTNDKNHHSTAISRVHGKLPKRVVSLYHPMSRSLKQPYLSLID